MFGAGCQDWQNLPVIKNGGDRLGLRHMCLFSDETLQRVVVAVAILAHAGSGNVHEVAAAVAGFPTSVAGFAGVGVSAAADRKAEDGLQQRFDMEECVDGDQQHGVAGMLFDQITERFFGGQLVVRTWFFLRS